MNKLIVLMFLILAGCATKKVGDSCGSNGLVGNDLSCMECSGSSSPSLGSGAGCSVVVNGVSCCASSSSSGGMSCSPKTGCGTWWLNTCDNYCYSTSSGGPPCSIHRQCY